MMFAAKRGQPTSHKRLRLFLVAILLAMGSVDVEFIGVIDAHSDGDYDYSASWQTHLATVNLCLACNKTKG